MQAGFNAVVLAGGTAARLDGVDKASVEVGGRTMLSRALDAVLGADEVVVVGDPVVTQRPVTFVREDPSHGGPVAGLFCGYDAMARRSPWLVVLACDMPYVVAATIARLRGAAGKGPHEGAVLVAPDGRRQLAFVVASDALDRVRPPRDATHGAALQPLLRACALIEVDAENREHRDIDSWADLREVVAREFPDDEFDR